MTNNIDNEIQRCLQSARAFEQLSDDFFHKGLVLRAAQYHRLAIETITRAERLAEQQARHRLACH
jgi:hypothetical protein